MAEKFISPFISDETAADENDDLTQLPIPDDALLFNDSLDEEVDPEAFLDLADTETANLPSQSAAVEPQANQVDGHHPSQSGSRRDLDDSLTVEDSDETQLPNDITHNTEMPTPADYAAEEPDTPSVSVAPSGSREVSPKIPSPENKSESETQEKTSVKEKTPSQQEKKAASPKASSKTASIKVKPSFGKRKKAFNPPKKAAQKTSPVCPTNTDSSEQSSSVLDESSSDVVGNKSTPERSKNESAELADSSKGKPQCDKSADTTTPAKTSSGAKKKGKVSAEKKVIQEQKKKEKEEKEREKALKKEEKEKKKQEKEAKKAELERQRDEKRLELERKKAEKELKKIEKEQKKTEKQSKSDKKKQQTKDKKTSDSSSKEELIEKNEAEPRSTEQVKEDKNLVPAVDQESEESKLSEEPEKVSEEADQRSEAELACKEASMQEEEKITTKLEQKSKEMEITEETGTSGSNFEDDEECGAEAEDVEERQEREEDNKENILPNETQISVNENGIDDFEEKIPVVVLSPVTDKPTEKSGRAIKKQNEKTITKMFTLPKAKKEASEKTGKQTKKRKNTQSSERSVEKSGRKKSRDKESSMEKTEHKKSRDGKGKKRKSAPDSDSEPEAKKSKPVNYHGPVWVQCENTSCKKWRLLKDCDDPANVPSQWVCSMNSDPEHNSCSAEEEQWSDLGDSQEFVESPYIPGSVVWSKMDGYPWWPAMVEEDPNEDTYYEMGYRDNPIPVKYHVVFFDTPVCRGWVSSIHTLSFTGQNDPNKQANVNIAQKHRRSLALGRKQATRAINISTKERLESFGFAKRFRGTRPEKRKRKREEDVESPEAMPSQWKHRGGSNSGERKSARLTVSSEDATAKSEDINSKQQELDNQDSNLLNQQHEE